MRMACHARAAQHRVVLVVLSSRTIIVRSGQDLALFALGSKWMNWLAGWLAGQGMDGIYRIATGQMLFVLPALTGPAGLD